MSNSKIFPGTTRTITVYVPAEYTADKPACLYLGLDGLGFLASEVFDNLIAQRAIPTVIGIGVSPGTVNSAKSGQNPRFDRSFEFDSLTGDLGQFLHDEVIPEVERRGTPDGRSIHISSDPNDRAIGGGSTGAIAAFNVAWLYPDQFRRVFSSIGTYVGMRGGEQYYVLVRKTEPKPLRVFMQDGVHDEWLGGPEMGDWWMSNQTMNRALEFAGYDVRHVWGAGTHNGNHATALFPEAMRWLWRDWPSPLVSGISNNPVLKEILEPNEQWTSVDHACAASTTLASRKSGEVLCEDDAGIISYLTNQPSVDSRCTAKPGSGFAFGPNGELYLVRQQGGIEICTNGKGRARIHVLAPTLHIKSLKVLHDRQIYAIVGNRRGTGEVWLIRPKGKSVRLVEGLEEPSDLALSPDGLWMFVAQAHSRRGMSYRVRADGVLDEGAPFYDFFVSAGMDDAAATQITVDRAGRAYVGTRMGVQVFDRNGRVTAILPLPKNAAITGICFGAPDFRTLFVAASGKVYRRRMKVAGAPSWDVPTKLPSGDPG